MNERTVLVLSSRKEAVPGNAFQYVVWDDEEKMLRPIRPGDVVKEPAGRRYDNRIRTVRNLRGDVYFCATDPDAEELLNLMENLEAGYGREIDTLEKRMGWLKDDVDRLTARLKAIRSMGFLDRIKFVLKGVGS